MLTITFADPAKWPLVSALEAYSAIDCSDVKTVTLEGDALELVALEFMNFPLPRYCNEWNKMTWWWTDAQFICANIAEAYKINKEALRGAKK